MSAQLNTIEGLAESLNEFIKEPNLHEKAILQVIDDLGTELLSNMAEKNIDIVCSVLFKENGPIFGFLSKCRGYSSGDLATAVSRCLQILCTFIKERQPQFQTYAKSLMVLAKFIAKSGANAVGRSSAFDVLLILFDKSNKYEIDATYIEDCYKTFADEYVVKGTPTVKAKIIELLGEIARYYPTIVNEQQLSRLKRWCFDNLTDQTSNDKKFEHATSLGYLNCLDSLIYRTDVEIVAKNSSDSDKLFHIILIILDKMANSNRYATPIAALNLFYHHTKLFSNLLLPSCEKLYACLYSWAGHHNTDAYKFGLLAFEEFIKQLSNVLYHNIQGERELQTFYTFMARFNKILEQADNVDDMYKVSIAIRSVGYFAKILTKVKNTDVEALRKSLVKISEWLYSDTNVKQLEYVRHLPAFIKAYTSFAQTMTTIPESLLSTLHHMCRIFIEWIPYATGYLRRSGCSNIYQLLLMLYKKGQGIGRSFANTLFERVLTFTVTNIRLPNQDSEPVYRKLLYFWKVILDKPKHSTAFGIKSADDGDEDNLYPDKEDRPTASTKKDLLDMLYDVFITNMMKIIKQFNLKVVNTVDDEKDAEDEASTDNVNIMSRSLRPVNRKDFILFQNLVDFWSALVKEINNKRLIQWIYIFGAALIESSVLHPMVSGFYRMISEILVICEKEQLFAGCEVYFNSASQSGQGENGNSKPDEYTTYLVYREYLKEVWHRLQQFTDELLATSLRLILAYPTEFFDITELITPLEKALRLGVTYHPLATIAMDSLDKLLDPNLNYDIDSNFLSRILPCINEYLLIGVVNFAEQADTKKRFKAPTAAERRYMMVHTKATSDEMGVFKQDYANLPELQRRMMQFLGRLGGKNKQLLAQGKDAIENNGMLAWDPVKKLKLRVPFMNVKVNIYLDEFLPRICELAESSPDRKVKIAACELLHGLVIYMIGNSAFSAKTWKASTESLYHTYYERVFPVMLKLAIDADPIARDMYQFFYSQIIHWLTNNAHADNPETIALLQSLLDASCDTDAGLRDYGAECIQEFVVWSIKQTSRSTDGAQNIKSLLKRLYNLMASSSASKRFGASLVFNRIYRQFREESALVDEYTFEILGQLFLSLKMAEVDHPSIGTRAQITEAINHITKIIERKADLFLKEKPEYRRPFTGANEVASLPQLVRWTFKESGSLQRNYIKLCISFFSKFVLLLPKVKSSKQWVSDALDMNPDFLVDIFETDHLQPPSILTDEDESHVVSIYLNWIKRLRSTLDAYIWLVERKIVDPKNILEASSSHFLLAIAFFIENKPSDYLEEKLNVNLAEKNKIISMYTYISVRTIYFIDLAFSSVEGDHCFRYVERVFSDTLYHKNFMDMVSQALILPKNMSEVIQSHHDNAITQSGVKRVFEIAQKYIATLIAKKSTDFIESLASSVSSTLVSSKVDLVLDTKKRMERSTLIEISQTVRGIKYLQSINALDKICENAVILDHTYPSSALDYCEMLLNTFLHQCKSAQEPLRIKLLGSMAVISFSHPGFAEKNSAKLLAFMIPAKRTSHKEKIEIFQKFDKYMVECITNHVDVFSELFKKYLTLAVDPEEDTYKTIHGYIMGLLDYLEANRLHERKVVWNFTDYLIKDESLLKTIVSQWRQTDQQSLDVISCLKKLFGANPALMSSSKGKPIFGLIWDVFISFLRHGNFGVRLGALDLLPVFICLGEKDVKTVINELRQNYINKLPPVQGKEYIKEGTVEYNMVISTLDKLLVPMVTFKSVALFDLLKVTFIQETHHIHEEAIKSSIQKFSQGLGLNSFLSITQSLMEFFKNSEYNIEHRNNIAQILLVLLKSANEGHVVEFFKKHVCYIVGFISNGGDRDNDSTDDLHMKANCLCFMQAYFNLISINIIEVDGPLDRIWTTSSENKDKKPVRAHILQTFKTLSNQVAHNVEILAQDRRNATLRYNREAFNVFATYVLRASDNAKMYRALFTQVQRKPSGSPFYYWDELVDPTQPIYLEIQLAQPLVKKRLERSSVSSLKPTKGTSTLYYMDSIDIIGSSLSQSTFSEVILEENQKINKDGEPSSSSADTDGDIVMEDPEIEESDTNEDKSIVDFEVDLLNDNTFMPMFTELVKQLHLNIEPPGETATKVPNWMNDLLEAFQSYDRKNAVKKQAYIAKLITNYPEAFEKFADSWILPLLKFVTKGNQFGESINYLVQDICIILIIWGQSTPLPTAHSHYSKRVLYDCLNYLMENVYHPNHRVLRSNIQIIKGLYENWGKACPVPTKTIYNQFHHSARETYKNTIGLQLVGIVFSNGIYVYDDHENSDLIDLPEDKFFYDLASNLTIRGRSGVEIRNNAAELMGWSLKFMKERSSRCYEDMRETFEQKFIDLSNDKNVTLTNYLRCINRMYLHDLEMGQSIVNNVVLRLYFATQEEKIMALEFINACYNQNEIIYGTLKKAGLNRMFSSKDEKLQTAALKMVNTMFDDMDGEAIGSIFRILVRVFPEHRNAECRSLYYSFIKKTYASIKFKDKVKMKAKAQLFRGLIDKDDAIALDIFGFITKDLEIDDNIRTTLLKITGDMYVSETEDIYLLYATRMILENTKKTYDFNEPIFQNSLTGAKMDATYRDIDTAWHSSSSMQPLFVDSQTKSKKLDMDDIDMQLRRTQTLMEFTHTVGSSQSLVSTFNPASQNHLDIEYDEDDIFNEAKSQPKKQKKIAKKESPYYKPRFVDASQAVISRFHADRYENLRKTQENLRNFKDEANEKKVSLTRSYRAGEIPDVQISHKDLLLPLEVLATADYNISRLLYSSLACSIINEMQESLAVQDYEDYKHEFVKMISKNLTMSELYFTPTIGSFLRIVFDLGAPISALLVKVASAKSDNHHIGIAILENQLSFSESHERPTKRVSRLSPTQEKWINLSLLYQQIDEMEIFENIYLTNVASNDMVQKALRFQIDGNYAVAFNHYDKALTESGTLVDDSEYNLWQEQMLFCRTQLGQWDRIGSDTRDAVEDKWDLLWTEKEDPYLEYFIKSYSKTGDERIMTGKEWIEYKAALNEEKERFKAAPGKKGGLQNHLKAWETEKRAWLPNEVNPLLGFLDEAYQNPYHKEKLLDKFACDWSMVEILRKEYNLGRLFIGRSYDSLLSSWTTLHPLAHTSRLARLSQLERTVETEDYLELHKKIEDKTFNRQNIETFIKALVQRSPDTQNDRMDVWHEILLSRLEYLRDLKESLFNDSPLLEELNIAKNQFVNITEDTALRQNNLSILPQIRKFYDDSGRYMKELCLIRYLQSDLEQKPDEEKAAQFERLMTRSLENKLPPNASNQQKYEQRLVVAESIDVLKQQYVANPAIFEPALKADTSSWVKLVAKRNLSRTIQDPSLFLNYLQATGFDLLTEAELLVDSHVSQKTEYLWKLGRYCDESLHLLEDEAAKFKPTIDPVQYAEIVIRNYFEAMDLGHREATNYFPRLLELIELYPATGQVFKESSMKFNAIWKYIRWIPQLVSSINGPIAPYILPALQALADSYPNSLFYPMQISCETYELRKSSLPKDVCNGIEKVMHSIQSPILEEFSNELKRLTNPYHIVKDFLAYIKSDLANDNVSQSFIASKYKDFHQLVLNNYSEKLGTIPKKLASKIANHFIRVLGEKGSKIRRLTSKNLTELDKFCQQHLESRSNPEEEKSLKSYSPWLNSFKSIEHDQELEIPGQYDGLSKPFPELHAKVAYIDPTLLVMHSLRKPKRIKIYGTDEKEYLFLVKGGEDLRQDERIQQAFGVMNDAVRKNKFCYNQDIQIGTYKVIPMASSLGIIEWLDNTTPLRACMNEQASGNEIEVAKRIYQRWIISNNRHTRVIAERYHPAYAKPRETVIGKFRESEAAVSANLVRDYLFKLASSPEAFLFSRKEFAYSLACICIFGYIMGIGDRHSDNFLVDLKSGRLVPIDFGYAFGVASELLPIPEIVPFRLTRQLVAVLNPLGIAGILEDTMTQILTAVQAEKELLLNILSVFVKEPQLEWKQAAKRQSKLQKKDEDKDDSMSASASSSIDRDIAWYPQNKIRVVKRKLNKGNPAYITTEELANGHKAKPYFDDIVRIAKGVRGQNTRANVGETCKTTNEQVRCLIDQATDPSVLGIAYEGWAPYL
ncbi:hypothetical protein BD408DRAFT_483034 [Parasitella parasitica]|nr:hypothetical protein BD408DRAFT_483034 [Parasitella parasitica]